jgi:SNF2 family DNA or RNA helicase
MENQLPLFKHQARAVEFALANKRVFNASDPGTGKTRTALEAILQRRTLRRKLILCPRTIMGPAWAEDIKKFTQRQSYTIATATNRAAAFESASDIVITNHDAVNWLAKHPNYLQSFDEIVVDESTAYKNPKSQRSKAIADIIKHFEYRTMMSGTFIPNGICDAWHQFYLLDEGTTLGKSFYKFRAMCCTSEVVNARGRNFQVWKDKPGIIEAVGAMIAPLTIRNKLEDCIDIPPNTVRTVKFDLSNQHQKAYNELRRHHMLECEGRIISAQNAAVLANKLLQAASGAVYDEAGNETVLSTERYDLICDLVEERPHSLVLFQWGHQREALVKEAAKRGLSYAVIDGTCKDASSIVQSFQSGELRVIFAHPKSAGHGLTLTKGTAAIWASPTTNLEHFAQANYRIYRNSQKLPTETILIAARGTADEHVYKLLTTKETDMLTLLENL